MIRYRADFLHAPSSAKVTITVPVDAEETTERSSALDAMGRRAALVWAHESGVHGLVLLGVIRLTDKMSVWREAILTVEDIYSGQLEDREAWPPHREVSEP